MELGLRVSVGFATPHGLDCRCERIRKAFYRAADELLTAFVELQTAIHEFEVSLLS
jgi:hypothetical protein